MENSTFEEQYIQVRKAEGRVLETTEIQSLPKAFANNPNKQEWQIRAKSAQRFQRYLKASDFKSLLEIGCGNGWFTHLCTKEVPHSIGIDVNRYELVQAKKAFPKTEFHYWDIFEPPPFSENFDCIVLNAVIQYFQDFKATIERLSQFLNPDGEIHILDSPFYNSSEVNQAKKRTEDYYTKIGFPEMSKYYFHHDFNSVKHFETLYQANKIKQFLTGKDSPFNWYRYKINRV